MKKLLTIGLIFALNTFLTGCNEESAPSASTPTVVVTAPRDMHYSQSLLQLRHQVELTAVYPTYYGSFIEDFQISPALPQGLYFSTKSGRITGTPEVLQVTPQAYTITGRNEKGSTSTQVIISIVAQAPFGIVYPYEQFTIIKGTTEIVSLIPFSNSGIRGGAKITQFSIAPALPAGLSFDSSTGAIEGYPTGGASPLTDYTITGINTGGSTTATIKIGVDISISKIASGGKHTCAVADNKIKCWGDNTYGQLGNNSSISSLIPVNTVGVVGQIARLSLGSEFGCYVSTVGQSYCWGRNHQNQFGPNVSGNKSQVTALGLGVINGMSVSASGFGDAAANNHACFTHIESGQTQCFGQFNFGSLAADSYYVKTNASTRYLSPYQNLYSGSNFLCVINNGTPKCLGDNSLGQLGDNQSSGTSSIYLTNSVLSNVTEMATGGTFSCALPLDNFGNRLLQCWGSNTSRQLGDQTVISSFSGSPITVKGIIGTETTQYLTLGKNFGCILVNGDVKCWGDNTYGQLGNGTTGGNSELVGVIKTDGTTLSSVTAMSAGEFHVCAISDNKLYCWGRNDRGQLGNASTADSNKARLVDNAISL